MKIYIIVGSIREGRVAIKVADWIFKQIKTYHFSTVEAEIVDLKEWADFIALADAIIFISPEYNHGYSPALKNALDYLGKEWQGKPAAYVGYGATNGSRSIDQIRQVGTQLGLVDTNAVIEIRDIFSRAMDYTFEGNEFDNKTLRGVVDKLIQYVSA